VIEMDEEFMRINLHDINALINILFKLMSEDEIPVCQIFAVLRQLDILADIAWKEFVGEKEIDEENFKKHMEKQLEQLEEDENEETEKNEGTDR
jgi:hypothetical protein